MNNNDNIILLKRDLIMRERTDDIKVETTYCNSCGFNHYSNIGTKTCAKCGEDK